MVIFTRARECVKIPRMSHPIPIGATQRESILLSRVQPRGVTSRRHAGYASCSSATPRATSRGTSMRSRRSRLQEIRPRISRMSADQKSIPAPDF